MHEIRSPASPGFSSESLTDFIFHGINTDPYEAAINFSSDPMDSDESFSCAWF